MSMCELKLEFNNYNKLQYFSETGMKCRNCKHYINSYYHHKNCNTVNMYDFKDEIIDSNFKNMMTHGLNGCVSGFIIYNDNNKTKIWFGHDPDKMKFQLELIKKLSNFKKSIKFVYIRGEGEYFKNPGDKYFKEKCIDYNEYYKVLRLFDCKYLIEPYIDTSNNFETSIYVKQEDGKLYYTNYFGNYLKV